jgi:GT2 family glycosyltransferase/glycosyltransferase involved in cell wall biosynthesis/SAM-dependent methyltransferase
MISAIKVGIPIIGSKIWLGGVSYIELLVKAVCSLPKDDRPQLFLIITKDTLPDVPLHEAIYQLFDGIIFVGNFPGEIPEVIIHLDSFTELFKQLDFYYPVLSDVWPGVQAASWIPDFQHMHLPHFFSDDEILIRSNSFARIAEQAQLIIFSSNDALNDFNQFFPQSGATPRVLSFYALPEDHWYAGDSVEVQRRYELPDRFLICCNQFWAHKNHQCLFEAIALLHVQQIDLHVVCTGSTTDYRDHGYFQRLKRNISDLGIEHLVYIVGNIPRHDQIQLIRRSMAVVQPSLFEGWSTVVEDCRALGKTILLSDIPVHREQAPRYGVYFDKSNPKDLVRLIWEMMPAFRQGPDTVREQQACGEASLLAVAFGQSFCTIVQESLQLMSGTYHSAASSSRFLLAFPESKLAHKWLDGLKGLEIGPSTHNPFGLNTRNVGIKDETYENEQISIIGIAAHLDIVARADIIPLPDESEDFILSSHVIEHCPDLIKTLVEWYRIIRCHGYVFLIVPHRNAAFSDRDRPLTDWSHIHTDFQNCATELTEPEAGKFGHCHYHVFSPGTLKDFIRRIFGNRLTLVDFQEIDDKIGNGFTMVYRKEFHNEQSTPWEYYPGSILAGSSITGSILVSAIVSTYNSEQFMRGCLDDLTSQSLFVKGLMEIVVVDSASLQNEGTIVKDFQERFSSIIYIRSDQRETIYEAWNIGIKAARGKYVTNANTDDRHRFDALEVMATTLENNHQVALVYGDVFVTNLSNQTFNSHVRCGYHIRPEYTPEIMLSGCHMGPQPMWRKNIHEQIGWFHEKLKSAGDYEFWCRIALSAPLLHIPQFLGLYFENPTGFCNVDIRLSADETLWVKQYYNTSFPQPPKSYTNNLQYSGPAESGRFVNIGMITFNRLEFTRQAINALIVHSDYPYVLTVVDNASNDGTSEYLKEMKYKGVIKNLMVLEENIGVAKASNLAWSLEPESKYYLKLDNDIVIRKTGWLGSMVDVVDRIPEIGVVAYNFEMTSYPLEVLSGLRIRPKLEGNLGGACILIPRRTFDILGYWCEDYGLYGEEDADYGYRVHLAGLRNIYMEDEEIGFHLPAGKAAIILDGSYAAYDGSEEHIHTDYRKWKDSLRRNNVLNGHFGQNLMAYRSGEKPICIASLFLEEFMPEVSIIIPLYNQAELTKNCLVALERNSRLHRYELILVDNGSTDETTHLLNAWTQKATIIRNNINLGFAAACNQGARASRGKIVLFLNNDTEPTSAWITPLLEALAEPGVSIAGSKLLFPDGTIQHAGIEFMNDLLTGDRLSPCHIGYRQPDGPEFRISRFFPAVTAASMAVPRQLFLKAGGFCEEYWNGFEDVDFCCKIQEMGYSIRYCPESIVIHHESKSGAERTVRQAENLALLQRRWGGKIAPEYLRISSNRVVKVSPGNAEYECYIASQVGLENRDFHLSKKHCIKHW